MGGIQSLGLVPDINDIFRTAFPEFIPELLLSHGMFAVPPQREMNAKAMLIGVIFKFRPDIHSCRVPVESVNCCQVQENGLLRTLVSRRFSTAGMRIPAFTSISRLKGVLFLIRREIFAPVESTGLSS